jgi:hypothetical protein
MMMRRNETTTVNNRNGEEENIMCVSQRKIESFHRLASDCILFALT